MRRSTGPVGIEQIIALLVAGAVVWLAGEQTPVQNWVQQTSPGERFLIPAAAFFLLYGGFMAVYDGILWRYVRRELNLDGVWIYQLHDRAINSYLYGVFEVHHIPGHVSVPRGVVWNCQGPPAPANARGTWSATRGTVVGYQVELVYEVKSLTAEPETGFGGYQGVFSFTVAAAGKMQGQFADLGLRRGHYGLVVAQRLRRTKFAEAFSQAEHAYSQPTL